MASALAFPLGFTLTSLRILDVDRRLGERRIREMTDAVLIRRAWARIRKAT